MRLVFASDTHTRHDALAVPEGDVFIHCGDFSGRGTLQDVERFGTWLATLPHRHKVVVAGNHDLALEAVPAAAKALLGKVDYLLDSGVTIDGVKFFGAPWQPRFFNWAFQLDALDLREKWSHIPDDTDVLVTHGPPYSVLDRNMQQEYCGDSELYRRLSTLKPTVHAFGHIHESAGSLEREGTLFVNASNLDAGYRLAYRCRVVDVAPSADGALSATEVFPPK